MAQQILPILIIVFWKDFILSLLLRIFTLVTLLLISVRYAESQTIYNVAQATSFSDKSFSVDDRNPDQIYTAYSDIQAVNLPLISDNSKNTCIWPSIQFQIYDGNTFLFFDTSATVRRSALVSSLKTADKSNVFSYFFIGNSCRYKIDIQLFQKIEKIWRSIETSRADQKDSYLLSDIKKDDHPVHGTLFEQKKPDRSVIEMSIIEKLKNDRKTFERSLSARGVPPEHIENRNLIDTLKAKDTILSVSTAFPHLENCFFASGTIDLWSDKRKFITVLSPPSTSNIQAWFSISSKNSESYNTQEIHLSNLRCMVMFSIEEEMMIGGIWTHRKRS